MFFELLKKPFPKEAVHFRAGATDAKRNNGKAQSAIALAYVTARNVMDRLDEVCGEGHWQDSYVETNSGRVICTLKIDVPGIGWISKSDGAGDTGTEGEKGAISDAFKRAAVKFGVGRYLYSFPNKWYPYDGWKFTVDPIKGFEFPKGATETEWKLKQSRKINKEVMQDIMIGILEELKSDDPDDLAVKELLEGLSDDEKGYVWALFSTKQRETLRHILGR